MPTISELIALVAAVPPIEANTAEDGAGTEHDVLHQLELEVAAAVLGFADAAAPVLVGLDAAVGDLDARVDALEEGGPGGAVARTVRAIFDGGSVDAVAASVEVGAELILRTPYALTLSSWTLLLEGATGSVTVDVLTKPFASGSYASITGSATPSASGGANAEGDVTGWSASVAAGHLIKIEITARTGLVPRVSLQVEGTQA
jgi:hypothetical protein